MRRYESWPLFSIGRQNMDCDFPFVNGRTMLYRRHNQFPQRAVVCLLAVLFALPASIVPSCACSATGQYRSCDCDDCPCPSFQIVGDDSCCRVSTSSLLGGFPLCRCTDNCPCSCNHNGQRSTQPVLNRQDSQDDLDSGDLRTESIGFVGLNSQSLAESCFPTAAPASALQRCISLSRFTL